jgi:hypothetical protein
MKQLLLLCVLVCSMPILMAQSYEKKYGTELFKVIKKEKKFDFSINGALQKKVGKGKEPATEIKEAVTEYLISKYADQIPAILKFSDAFASAATNMTGYKAGDIMSTKTLAGGSKLTVAYKADADYIFFVDDGKADSEPITLLSKNEGGYQYHSADISGKPAAKKLFAEELAEIVKFVSERKDITLPEIQVQSTASAKMIVFKNQQSPNTIEITEEQFGKLKGGEVSNSEGVITYAIKNGSGQKNDPATTKTPEGELSLGKKNLQIGKQVYVYDLIKKDDDFFVKLCGPQVKKDEKDPTKEFVSNVEKTCSTSTSKISDIEELKDFQIITDDAVKKLNAWVDVSNDDYKKKIEALHNYYKDALSKQKEKEKKEKDDQAFRKNSHLKEIEEEKKTFTAVGIIELPNDKMINLYFSDANGNLTSVEQVQIDSVDFSIEEGALPLRRLIVYTAKGIYTNQHEPIPINKLNGSRRVDALTNVNGEDGYLRAAEVLKIPKDITYVPDDIYDVMLTAANPKKVLHAASDLNSMINFSLYSDLAGLLGRRANALVMTDVSGRFLTNTGNFSLNRMIVVPFQFIDASISISKFDSRFKSLDSSNIKLGQTSAGDTIDRMQLMQTAWLKGCIKLNLFSTKFKMGQALRLNFGSRINVINADSFYRKERDIYLFEYFPELAYSISRVKNFGMDMSIRYIVQRLAGREPFANKGWEKVVNPHVAFFYYPFDNPGSTIYLRFNYFANTKENSNNFYQLQFGWKTGLDFSKK